MTPDEHAIRALHTTWMAAVDAGDLAGLFTLMADDAVFFGPGREPFGRDGFRQGFSDGHRKFRIRCTSALEEVVVMGDVAFARSRDSLSLVSRDGGLATALAGHRMTVYRRQTDGRWLLARDAHTLTPLAQ